MRYAKRVADELNATVDRWWEDQETYPRLRVVVSGKEVWTKETTKKFIFNQTMKEYQKGENDYLAEEVELLF